MIVCFTNSVLNPIEKITSFPLLTLQITPPGTLTSKTAIQWSSSMAAATSLFPDGEKAKAAIPLRITALK